MSVEFGNKVENIKALAEKFGVLEISNVVLKDERFPFWSGSHKPELHHYGVGGLARHTWEVIEFSLRNNEFFWELGKGVDNQKLFLAALFHDSGKMWDYQHLPNFVSGPDPQWQATKHKRRVYHLPRSSIVWSLAKEKFNYKDEEDDILHAILAHHGRREYGSPVSPDTRLAWILHLSDSLSARGDDCFNGPLHQQG